MNSHQIFNHEHFQILSVTGSYFFYSDAFTKVRFMKRTLPSTLNHWHCCWLQDFKTWVNISQLKKVPPDIWCSINAGDLKIKLTRKRSSWHRGTLLPPKMLHQQCFFSPWLVWLSGLRASLWTKGLPVQFPVRAHA